MDILKLYLKLSKVIDQSKGFTLIELLVAILMSGIIMVGLGSGMIALMNSSNTSAVKVDLKNQLNRALDYINEDIKRARFAGIATTVTTNDTVLLTYFESASDNTAHTIAYYMTASSNPWLGPNVVRRSVNGGDAQVLVDALTDNAITFPSCGGNATTATTGFRACVETEASNRGVDVYRVSVSLFGEISDNSELEVTTRTIARSVSPRINPPVLTVVDSDPRPDVTWSVINGATSYEIYRCTTTGGASTCDPTTPLETPVYGGSGNAWEETINTTAGERWCYVGRASDGVNFSEFSTPPQCGGISTGGNPSAIADLDASDAVLPTVTWGEAIDAESYSLYSCPAPSSGTCTPDLNGTPVFGPSLTRSFTETVSPPPGQKTCYVVKAVNATGTSVSNEDCGLANSNSTPTVPTVTIDSTNSNIVNWTDVSASGATTYYLYQCQTPAGTSCTPNILFTGFPQFVHTATQTVPATVGNNWCYGVKAVNTTPEPDLESALSAPPVCGAASLDKPFFTSALTGSIKPTVNWNTVSDATSYELYRCSTATTCDPSTGTRVTPVGHTSTTFTETTDPLNNQKHCYAVRAKNTGSISVFSDLSCGDIKIANCTFPNVLGYAMPEEQTDVNTVISNAGFSSTPTYDTTSITSGTKGEVRSTDPVAGTITTCGTAITIRYRPN